MAKKRRLRVPKGEKGGSVMDGHFGGLGDVNSYVWNGWALGSYCTAQGNVCDWVTLLYNRTWWNIVNQLHFNNNNNNNKRSKYSEWDTHGSSFDLKIIILEFSLWLSGLWTQLVSVRMWIQSLASLSGLRIWHCCELWDRSQVQLGSGVAVAVV